MYVYDQFWETNVIGTTSKMYLRALYHTYYMYMYVCIHTISKHSDRITGDRYIHSSIFHIVFKPGEHQPTAGICLNAFVWKVCVCVCVSVSQSVSQSYEWVSEWSGVEWGGVSEWNECVGEWVSVWVSACVWVGGVSKWVELVSGWVEWDVCVCVRACVCVFPISYIHMVLNM